MRHIAAIPNDKTNFVGVTTLVTNPVHLGRMMMDGFGNPSRVHLEPASPHLLSEPALVARLARAVLGGGGTVDWEELAGNYDRIRDRIERVIPGFERFNERIRTGVFYLPNAPRDERRFQTASGRAQFTVHPIPRHTLAPGQFVMMTMRSHDQFNTTIYGLDDRYRGIFNGRRVVFLNAEDMAEAGLQQGQLVDLTSHFGGVERRAPHFLVAPYPIPRRCAATYFPEANVLVPIDSVADRSNTPASRSVQWSYWVRNFAGETVSQATREINLPAGQPVVEDIQFTPSTDRDIFFAEVSAVDKASGQEVFARANLILLPPHTFKSTPADSVIGLSGEVWPFPSKQDMQRLLDRLGVRWLRQTSPEHYANVIANRHDNVDLKTTHAPEERDKMIREILQHCIDDGNPAWEFANESNYASLNIGLGKHPGRRGAHPRHCHLYGMVARHPSHSVRNGTQGQDH